MSFAGNLTEDPEVRSTEAGIARAVFRVAVSGRGQEAWFFTVVVWRDQAEHASQSLAKGSRVVVLGRLQQRAWTAEDGIVRSVVEVVAEELAAHLSGRPEALVFTAPQGGPLRVTAFRGPVWRPATRAAGLDGLRIHDLGHTPWPCGSRPAPTRRRSPPGPGTPR